MNASRLPAILFVCILAIVNSPIQAPAQTGPPPVAWEREFGRHAELGDVDSGSAALQTADGGYVVAGGSTLFFRVGFEVVEATDLYLLKTDGDGNLLWETFRGEDAVGRSVQETETGEYVVAGSREFNVYLLKTDGNGNVLWDRSFGGVEEEVGNSLQVTDDGDYVVAGTKGDDVCLLKTDSDGNLLWERVFGGDQSDKGNSLQVTADGDYVVAGSSGSDVYLLKTDSDGSLLWERSFGGELAEMGNALEITTDGDFIIAGGRCRGRVAYGQSPAI